ncbi:SDR family NAD(P)-dependent oxidoreductase [Tomitella biformata]|uniref:SDR family NAD(P)-dependent oxidoreductase n=1 Tax=Tomitella biformata TaxID=630403 RepID=UPI00068679EC|nr:SDR family NAD(P)-dependent oxidoreductase [Tomitella biformata]
MTTDEVLDGVDLGGRTALVTGPAGGLGTETVRALAAAGARVILAARAISAAEAVAARIWDAHPGAELDILGVDLADLDCVRALGDRIADRGLPIDILINNAGVMYTPFARTRDDFELQFGVNHLGHFALTTALLPALIAAAERSGVPARVITLSSDAHKAHPVDLADPNFVEREYNKFVAYGQSKSANALMTVELQRRFGDQGLRAFAVHPGVCATGIARHMSRDDMAEMKRMAADTKNSLANLKAIPEAAATSVWGATAPELDTLGGAYLADCALGVAAEHATDPETAEALWTLSATLTS